MSPQAIPKISPPGGAGTELLALAIAGDRAAFATLYNAHRDEVLRYLIHRTKDRWIAEDLTQETFIRAMRSITTFAPRTGGNSFVAWVMVIARNLHLDYLRLARVQKETPVGQVDDSTVDTATDVAETRGLNAVEAGQAVAVAMTVLTPNQRRCVELRFFEELTGPETAAAMGKGLGAVKTLQFRAMQRMHTALTSEAVAA